MKNKIEDLRNHLFAALERLGDAELDLEDEIKRANAVVSVAGAIIDSANTEITYLKTLDRFETTIKETDFFAGNNKQFTS